MPSCNWMIPWLMWLYQMRAYQCWSPQLAPSAASVQAFAAWGEGSVSGGLKRGPKGPTVHFPRATPLGCHCCWWSLQGTMISRGGPWPCAAWGHDSHNSGSHHYTGTNPLSGWYHWASLRHHHGHKPASPGALEQLQWTSPAASTPVSQHSMPGRSHLQCFWGPTLNRRSRRSPQVKETDLAIPALVATFTESPHSWPHQVTPPISPTPFPNYSHKLYHRHLKWWASPLSPSTRLLLGLGQQDWLMSFSTYRREWMWP